jgi:hypothetical protein
VERQEDEERLVGRSIAVTTLSVLLQAQQPLDATHPHTTHCARPSRATGVPRTTSLGRTSDEGLGQRTRKWALAGADTAAVGGTVYRQEWIEKCGRKPSGWPPGNRDARSRCPRRKIRRPRPSGGRTERIGNTT